MRRREFCRAAATAPFASGILVGKPTEPDARVEVFATRKTIRGWGSDGRRAIANAIESTFDKEVGEGRVRVVERATRVDAPSFDRAVNAQRWWASNPVERCGDSNLLLTDQWWSDFSGYADLRGDTAVLSGYQFAQRHFRQRLAVHEVGHNFGLRHYQGRARRGLATIMYDGPKLSDSELPMTFSDRSVEHLDGWLRRNS